MSTDQTIFYIVTLVAIALILLLVGVVIAYLRMIRKFVDLKEGRDRDINPQTLIAQAHVKSQRILDEAQFEARNLINKAQSFLNTNEGAVVKELNTATQIYAKKYEEALLATQTNIVKVLQTIPDDSKKMLQQEMSGIRIALQTEVNKAATEAKAMVTEAYKKAEMEVEGYKKERMRQIDESIVMILKDVARKVLSKEISQEEHEKLVIKALEEAKQENVFMTNANGNTKISDNQVQKQ